MNLSPRRPMITRIPLPPEPLAGLTAKPSSPASFFSMVAISCCCSTTKNRRGVATSYSSAINLVLSLLSTKGNRSEEHTSELQSREKLVCPLVLEKQNTLMQEIAALHNAEYF